MSLLVATGGGTAHWALQAMAGAQAVVSALVMPAITVAAYSLLPVSSAATAELLRAAPSPRSFTLFIWLL